MGLPLLLPPLLLGEEHNRIRQELMLPILLRAERCQYRVE